MRRRPPISTRTDNLFPTRRSSDLLDPYDIGGMNYHWRKSTIFDCNWKVAIEAFNEGYHVQTTHNQMLRYFDDWTQSYARGRSEEHTSELQSLMRISYAVFC